MQIIVDLDGTICTEEKMFSRALAKPLPGAVDAINSLYNKGHTVIIYSARMWIEYEMTYQWLQDNNVKFSQLVLGKPQGDVWIDDRAVAFTDWDSTLQKLNSIV